VKIQASPSIVFSSLLSSPLLYSSLPQEGRKESGKLRTKKKKNKNKTKLY
jgi:hypothetical protein